MAPRIQIRTPRKEQPVSLADTWKNVLEPAVQQIFRLQAGTLSFAAVYHPIYLLVNQGHGKALHRKLMETTQNYLRGLPPINRGQGADVLPEVSRRWVDLQSSLTDIGHLFIYLNRFCDETGNMSTDQLGKQLFRDIVVSNVLDLVFDELLIKINAERHGELVDSQVLKSVVQMLRSLTEGDRDDSPSLFDTKFRSRLISSTIDVYETKLGQLETLPSIDILNHISDWLRSESKRGALYLPQDTTAEVLSNLEHEVVSKALPRIFRNSDTGVSYWISSNNLNALSLASELEVRSESNSLVSLASDRLFTEQQELNVSKDDPVSWVEETSALRSRYHAVATAIGRNSRAALEARHNEAISSFRKASEILALYLDEHLKKNSAVSTDNIDETFEKAISLYNAIDDRDEFGMIFQRLLARRLLNNSSKSREYELGWLQRLKETNPNSDAPKFEQMIMNIDESRRMFYGSNSISPGIIPTNVNVLSMHLWPKSMQPRAQYPLALPPPLAEAKAKFEDFYKSVKRDRILKWNCGLSNADVKIRVGEKAYIASVPLVCMAILGLFEGDEIYTAQEIADITKIPFDGELERHLKSLYLAPATKLLVKEPPTKEVAASDKFRFNQNFSSPKPRFKVKVVSAKPSTASEIPAEDAELLLQERSQKTEAAIVRIMKARGELLHAQLVQQASNLLQRYFKASPSTIKKAIQSLLNKGYLARSEADMQLYRYVA